MDRNDLIRALGNAFTEPPKGDESTSTIVSAAAGEKDVLRLLTNYDNASERHLHENHPDVPMVGNLVEELAASGQGNVEIVGRELMIKFNNAIANNDEAKIADIVATCRTYFLKLRSLSKNSPERALLYMTIIDKIKKM